MKKIILMPMYILLVAFRMTFAIMIRLSDWIFYIIGFMLLLVTAASYYFGLESGDDLRKMIIGSGVFFLIPQVASFMEGLLEICTMRIGKIMGGH